MTNQVQQIEWSDGIGSRGRSPFLLFLKDDEVIVFRGETIPGVVVVRGTSYKKNGKWSETIYRLGVMPSIRHIAGRDGWETGRFVEGLGSAVGRKTPDTWAEVAQALGVSVPSTMEFLRAWRPKAAAKLDEVEQQIADLDEFASSQEEVVDVVRVTVSFGSPTNRAIKDGFWESPKTIPGHPAEIRLIDPAKGWVEGNINVVGMSGSVLSVKHAAGMHGGYYAVSVAVVPGTETEVPPHQTACEEVVKECDLSRSPVSASSSGGTTLGDALRKAGVTQS